MTDIALMHGIFKATMETLAAHPRLTRSLVGAVVGGLYGFIQSSLLDSASRNTFNEDDRRDILALPPDYQFIRKATLVGTVAGAAVFGHP